MIREIINLYLDMYPYFPMPCAEESLIRDCEDIVRRTNKDSIITASQTQDGLVYTAYEVAK